METRRHRPPGSVPAALVLLLLLGTPDPVRADLESWTSFTARGRQLQKQRKYREAERMYLSAAKAARDLDDKRRRYLESLGHLANLYKIDGRKDQAVKALGMALDTQIRVHGKDHPSQASTYYKLAQAEENAGRDFEAAAHLEQAAALLTDRGPKARLQAAKLRIRRAELLEGKGQPAGAVGALDLVLPVWKEIHGDGSNELLELLEKKLALEQAAGKKDAAYRTRLELNKQLGMQEDADPATRRAALAALASEAADKGDHAEAVKRWEELLPLEQEGGTPAGQARALRGMGEALFLVGDSSGAALRCQEGAKLAGARGEEAFLGRLCAARALEAVGRGDAALRELAFAKSAGKKGDRRMVEVLEIRVRILQAMGRHALVSRELTELLAIQESAGVSALRRARTLEAMAVSAKGRGDLAEAARARRSFLKLREESGVKGALLADGYLELARLELARGQFDLSGAASARALEALGSSTAPVKAEVLSLQGEALRRQKRYDQAQETLHRALDARKAAGSFETLAAAGDLYSLGVIHQARRNIEQAKESYERALELAKKAGKAGDVSTARIWNGLALALKSEGKKTEPEDAFAEALKIMRKAGRTRTVEYATYLNNMAVLLAQRRQRKSARRHWEEALPLYKKYRGEEHLETVEVESGLAALAVARKDWTTARKLYPRVIKTFEIAYGKQHQALATPLFNYASALLRKHGRKRKAKLFFRRALEIAEASYGAEHPTTKLYRDTLGRFGKFQ